MYEYTNIKKEKGFTLVELLVAMSVFTALLAFAVGVFVQGMRSERQVTEEIAVNNEMSLVLEQLVREIRTGSFFAPLGGYTKGNGFYETQVLFPIDGAANLQFEDESVKTIMYRLQGSDADARLERDDGSGVGFLPLTGKDTSVQLLKFFVSREEFCTPPRVTVLLEVRAAGSTRPAVPIQTTVSSRVFPLDLKRDDNKDNLNDFEKCRSNLVR